jgi:disulfide bond formation protein DsbB
MFDWLLFNIHLINTLYAVAGLVAIVVTLVLLYDLLRNEQKLYLKLVAPYVWFLIAATSFGGVATTLLYSEVFGFIPCSLCWLQRVALYPQAVMTIVAWRLKDVERFPLYGMALSAFGFVVAVYQYIYQMVPTTMLESGLLPCLADGTADCSKKVMEVFGFVTFPFLSAVIFAFLIVLYLHMRRAARK